MGKYGADSEISVTVGEVIGDLSKNGVRVGVTFSPFKQEMVWLNGTSIKMERSRLFDSVQIIIF